MKVSNLILMFLVVGLLIVSGCGRIQSHSDELEPVFYPDGGTYSGPVTVEILPHADAEKGLYFIYYTVDGSEPTVDSNFYTGPLTFTQTTNLKSIIKYLAPSKLAKFGDEIITAPTATEYVVKGVFAPVCGNGILEGFEACDDGNTNNGDGCSSTCLIESDGYVEGLFVVNGYFESTDMSTVSEINAGESWLSDMTRTLSRNTVNPISGSADYKIVVSTTDSDAVKRPAFTMTLSEPTIAGETYTISFDVKQLSGTSTFKGLTFGFDSLNVLSDSIPSGQITHFEYQLTSVSSWDTLNLHFNGESVNSFQIDNVLIDGNGPAESTCDDGIQNGDETGVDCGGSCSACQQPPTVEITQPTTHNFPSGVSSINIVANANDEDGNIDRVEFYKDLILGSTDNTYPYEATLRNPEDGNFLIIVKAFDDSGNQATDSMNIVVEEINDSLIVNGDFETGMVNWDRLNKACADNFESIAGTGNPDHGGRVYLGNGCGGGEVYYVGGLTLEPNADYKLTFDARTSNNFDMDVSVRGSSSGTNYGMNSVFFDPTSAWQTYEHTFTTSGFGSAVIDGELFIEVTQNAPWGNLYLDNVELEKINDPLIVTNGDFESGMVNWDRLNKSCADNFESVAGGNPGNTGRVYLGVGCGGGEVYYVGGLTLEPNADYKLTFDARTSNNFDMDVSVRGSSSGTNYGMNRVFFDPTSAWQTYEHTFTTSGFGSAVIDGELFIEVTQNAPWGNLYLDNVELEKINDPLIVTNGDFESGMVNWDRLNKSCADNFESVAGGNPGNTGRVYLGVGCGGGEVYYVGGLTLEPNADYKLTFDARTSNNFDMDVSVRGSSSGTNYGMNRVFFDPTSAWQTYEHTFTTSGFGSAVIDGELFIEVTQNAPWGNLYLDNVELEKITTIPPPPSSIFYISSSLGNDAWNGHCKEFEGNDCGPWKTLNKVNSKTSSLQPGDNLLFRRGDTWAPNTKPIGGALLRIYDGMNGEPGNHIVIGAYGSGEKPVLSMENLRYESVYGFRSGANKHITLKDLKFILDNDYPSTDWTGFMLFISYIDGEHLYDWKILNLDIDATNLKNTPYPTMFFYQSDLSSKVSNVEIAYNTIFDANDERDGDSINIGNPGENLWIHHNKIFGSREEGIDLAGGSNHVVEYNLISGAGQNGMKIASQQSLFTNSLIRHNLIIHPFTSDAGSEWPLLLQNIENNIIEYNTLVGHWGAYFGDRDNNNHYGTFKDNTIRNNIITGAVYIAGDDYLVYENIYNVNEFKNNLYYYRQIDYPGQIMDWILIRQGLTYIAVIDENNFVELWQSKTDSTEIGEDPGFANPYWNSLEDFGDFTPTNPNAIDKGADLTQIPYGRGFGN